MQKYFRTNDVAAIRDCGAVGAETTQNKRGEPKIQVKRVGDTFLRMTCFALLAGVVIFSGCKKDKDKPKEPEMLGKATLRYETVPYSKSSQKSNELDNLVFYDYEGEYNIYFFVLGHVKSVPVGYRSAFYYDGRTPITITYSASNVTQETVSNSVTEAFEHSVTKSNSTTWDNKVTGELEFGGFIAPKFKSSYEHSWGGSESTSIADSRSFSNTYETSKTKASETKDEISSTIGDHGEPAGWYRYSLFSTTDVYYIVITDRAKTKIIESYVTFCARPTQGWGLDYNPDRDGLFGKTASGELLKIPAITLSQLPDISECPHQWGTWDTIVKPTPTTEGERIRICSLCLRTEKESIPKIVSGEINLNIEFGDYQITSSLKKDYFCKGWYWLGIEIGTEDGKLIGAYPEDTTKLHSYGLYDDGLKDRKEVTRTYPAPISELNVKVERNKSFYIKFKTRTDAHRYWWTIVAIFGETEKSIGEQKVYFDYDASKDNWVARKDNTDKSVTFNSASTSNYDHKHTVNYLITKK
jgi:hypothetical protein